MRQIRDVALSPDGSEVAFTALGRLYVMAADGGTPREIGAEVGTALFHPAWSPDGETIAAVSWVEPDGGHLHTVTVDNGRASRISDVPRYLQSPAWSPGGDRIVVLQAPVTGRLSGQGGDPTDIAWYPAGGGGATVVAEALGRSQPHFRTDDPDRIYLHSFGSGLCRSAGTGPTRERTSRSPGSPRTGVAPLRARRQSGWRLRVTRPWPGSATTSTW